MRGNKRCLKNKDAKLASAKQLSVLFLLACVVSYLQLTCLEGNYVGQSLKGWSNSSISPSVGVLVQLPPLTLWNLPLPAPTCTADLKRMTVIQNKNKTLLNQFPLGRNKHIRSHSSSDRDKPRAQGAQQKRHKTVRREPTDGDNWRGCVDGGNELIKLSRLLFTLLRNINSQEYN